MQPVFRLEDQLEVICKRFKKPPPSLSELVKIAREHNLPLRRSLVTPALYEQGPFTSSLLFALASYFEVKHEDYFKLITFVDPQTFTHNGDDSIDLMISGIDRILQKFIKGYVLPRKSLIGKRRQLEKAVTEMTLQAGRQAIRDAGAKSDSSDLSCLESARKLIGMPLEDIVDTIASWWKKNPNTTLRAIYGNGNYVGFSTAAPITLEAYDSVRNGELHTFSITCDSICVKSDNILIPFCDINEKNQTPFKQKTKTVANTLVVQCALNASNNPKQFKVLAVGGSKEARTRLASNGFRALGVPVKGTDSELFELSKSAAPIRHRMLVKLMRQIRIANELAMV